MANKNKVVLLLDSFYVEYWMAQSVKQVVDSEHSEIVQIVLNKDGSIHKNKFFRFLSNLRKVFYFIFVSLDWYFLKNKLVKNSRTLVDIRHLFEETPDFFYADLDRTKYTDVFHKSTIERISEVEPDVIVRFGFRILKGEILTLSKYGVLSYHHGDPVKYRGGPAAFWEVVNKEPMTGCILQKLGNDLDGGIVLCDRFVSTNYFSPASNYDSILVSSIPLLELALKRFHSNSAESFSYSIPYSGKILKAPSNFRTLIILVSLFFRVLKRSFQKIIYIDQWVLYLGNSNINQVNKFIELAPPIDRFWADPFLLQKNGNVYVFFEELYYGKKAHISVGLLEDNRLVNVSPVIVEDYHLSYPFIIEYKSDIYMIPESSKNGSIDIYICEDFPFKWKKLHSIIDNINAVDSTVHLHNGIWWLFTTVTNYERECPHSMLHIYYSECLLSQNWKPHNSNPIYTNVSLSRQGGKFIIDQNNDVYRVSQDCSVRYGYGLNIFRVKTLNHCTYEETLFGKLLPSWNDNLWATHTYNVSNDFKIIDALVAKPRFNFYNLFKRN